MSCVICLFLFCIRGKILYNYLHALAFTLFACRATLVEKVTSYIKAFDWVHKVALTDSD